MSFVQSVKRIAIVGTGVIGSSWAALYLARGFEVVAVDPAPNAEDALRQYIDREWPILQKIGLSPGASREKLTFTTDLKQALDGVDFVQENGPERPDFKAKFFAQIDAYAPKTAILASSSSGLTMDVIQAECINPERCVIGHPFNPPHVIPLVEVVGGAKTSEQTIESAMQFYDSIGKKAIRLHKAFPGHVANRLQAALYKEMLYLVQEGVLSVEDCDAAVSFGPGVRWGCMGQSLQWHLGGGVGGIQHFMEHLMDPLAGLMNTLGNPNVDDALKRIIIAGVLKEAGGRSVSELTDDENSIVVSLLALRKKHGLA
ncbi:3-hydroxyacyl-CoA dehydrogenase NAD-binding domain-containing protein [Pseudomonas sp. 17104299]|uniref:3-hydroxyacyl-CoA dehydrogenase NAD-binding domain-containing protein n=1 Tax=Pseudomonas sp. 17104299 TaxID=2952239 RepID=UPI002157563E|nr:3-hydroxyacyl-CoA dehydrogenase NAD-binding domain-containing protein [Pseudomonas sp. 17104299]